MNNNHWRNLYVNQSELYDRLVQAEDYTGNLMLALNQLYPFNNAQVVEFGAGTGRITTQLTPHVGSVRAFDLTPSMIRIAHRKLKRSNRFNWNIGLADSRAMPLPAACADVAIEGWSFVQIMTWHMDAWRQHLGRAIQEMLRVVRPGGLAILIETLGTGETIPKTACAVHHRL
jgi:ubiquinone/menaquinone biosynthesis C-methylase UbiE